jgi:hypothetical protein
VIVVNSSGLARRRFLGFLGGTFPAAIFLNKSVALAGGKNSWCVSSSLIRQVPGRAWSR